MMSVDHVSIYSTSTLVGGGEEEIRAEEQRQRETAERAYLAARQSQNRAPTRPNRASARPSRASTSTSTSGITSCTSIDFNEIASRVVGGAAPLSRQSSITTLYAQPTLPPATTNRRVSQTPTATTHSDDPDSDSAQDHEISRTPPRVPWWSPMVPNPPIGASSGSPSNLNRNRLIRSMSDPDSNFEPATDYASISASSSNSASLISSRGHQSMPPLRQSSSLSDFRLMSNSSTSGRRISDTATADAMIPPSPPSLPDQYQIYTKWYCEENAYILAAYLARICRYRNELKSTRLKWDVDVIIVSNKDQSVALWQQKAGLTAESDYQVIWDYHVFVVLSCQRESALKEAKERTRSLPARHASSISRKRSAMSRIEEEGGIASTTISALMNTNEKKPLQSWVYDLDSRITSPAPLKEYISSTFGLDNGLGTSVNKRYRPMFRVIPASTYFTRFGSDRSHMKRSNSSTDPTLFEWISPPPSWNCIMGKKALQTNSYFMDSFVDMRVKIGDGRFGQVVKMNDLIEGGGCLMTGKLEAEKSGLAPSVALLLDEIDNRIRQERQERSNESQFIPTGSQEAALQRIVSALQIEDEEPNTPGTIIGGVQRYGLRPPPPDGAVISTASRGKRIMDPLFPAYIASVFEHLAA